MSENSQLAVYKNELNTVPLRSFNAVEMDLFFSICAKMRNKGLSTITYSFDDLKELSRYKATSIERFVSDLDRTYSKLLALNIANDKNGVLTRFVLFNKFVIDRNQQIVEIQTNSEFEYIINELTGNFTKFELEEFTELRSSYSKTAFRLLKQFRQTGFWRVSIEDFRELLDIPKTYRMIDIDDRVFKPIVKELSSIFENLKIKKNKAKKSRRIEYLEFTFSPQDDFNINGEKTFRDEDGNYYQKDFMHLTDEEFKKSGLK